MMTNAAGAAAQVHADGIEVMKLRREAAVPYVTSVAAGLAPQSGVDEADQRDTDRVCRVVCAVWGDAIADHLGDAAMRGLLGVRALTIWGTIQGNGRQAGDFRAERATSPSEWPGRSCRVGDYPSRRRAMTCA